MTTKKLSGLAVLTALYCVLGAMVKIPIIGAISLDLGYIAFAIACEKYHTWGVVVGAVGCAFESIMFTPYGFSISWFVANVIIGIGCGVAYKFIGGDGFTNKLAKAVTTILFVLIGVGLVKTIIECNLYAIPFEVKIVKNAVASTLDSITMLIGLFIYGRIKQGEI